MRSLLPLATLLTLAGPIACGSTPAPVTPTAQREGKPTPAQVAANAPFDLSPIAEPADVVGVVRWSNPTATLSNIATCAGLPSSLVDANAQTLVSLILREALGKSVNAKQFAAVVALDAPVHLLVSLDSKSKLGKPFAAVSLGLSSLERAKGALEGSVTLTEAMPGMWKLGIKSPSAPSCFIAASAGSAPARLICGARDRDVTALGPYLARTLPTLAPDARDAHAELRFVPLDAKFGDKARQQLPGLPILAQSQLSIGEPKFDRALLDAARGVQDELVALTRDADKLTIDLNVDNESCLSVTENVQLRGATSWYAGTLSNIASRAATPPALFWRLPKDSDAAFFAHGVDSARYTEILNTLRPLLEGWLTQNGIGKPADRKALADLLGVLFDNETNSVSAYGHIDAPPPTTKGGKPSAQDVLAKSLEGWLGWSLVGIEKAPADTIKRLNDLVAVYNRPALLTALKKQVKKENAWLLPTLKTTPAPKELGKSSLAIEMAFKDIALPEADPGLMPGAKPGAKPKTISLTLHVLVAGEDKATWVAIGTNKQELLKQFATVKNGAPEAGMLVARPGLDVFKASKLASGGFFTIAPLTRSFGDGLAIAASTATSSLPPEMRQFMNTLGNLPNKGEGLMLLTTQVQGGGAPRAELSFKMSKPAFEDVGAIVLAGLKLAGVFNH